MLGAAYFVCYGYEVCEDIALWVLEAVEGVANCWVNVFVDIFGFLSSNQ